MGGNDAKLTSDVHAHIQGAHPGAHAAGIQPSHGSQASAFNEARTVVVRDGKPVFEIAQRLPLQRQGHVLLRLSTLGEHRSLGRSSERHALQVEPGRAVFIQLGEVQRTVLNRHVL